MGGDDILKCKIKNSELAKENIALQGLTQVEFSVIVGISKSYLSQVLNGKRT
ncbi:helix-turn-helix domain-containing protein, partial [Lactiplantibacillus plantarum]|uniref:helix-turn-helix domain-containing protein n=1 Tax=Lactiplantibacillus plantarum TaxID=1590 RepID=UPI001160CBC7